jgi:DNA-binding MarR family transcriptional regulator
MTEERPRLREGEAHTPALMSLLLQQARAVVLSAGDGLRPSHLRVLSAVPSTGLSVSEIALRVDMTKQGCGQFVDALEQRDLLRTAPDPGDRRRRLVHRTRRGDAAVRGHARRIAALEREWQARVGARRYATFRAVLVELALTDDEA